MIRSKMSKMLITNEANLFSKLEQRFNLSLEEEDKRNQEPEWNIWNEKILANNNNLSCSKCIAIWCTFWIQNWLSTKNTWPHWKQNINLDELEPKYKLTAIVKENGNGLKWMA